MPKEKNKSKSFILRVDNETMSAIEAWAADEFRSTNGQLQWIITEALRKAGRLPKKRPAYKRTNEELPTTNTEEGSPDKIKEGPLNRTIKPKSDKQ